MSAVLLDGDGELGAVGGGQASTVLLAGADRAVPDDLRVAEVVRLEHGRRQGVAAPVPLAAVLVDVHLHAPHLSPGSAPTITHVIWGRASAGRPGPHGRTVPPWNGDGSAARSTGRAWRSWAARRSGRRRPPTRPARRSSSPSRPA